MQSKSEKKNIKNRREDKNERTNRKIIIQDTDLPVILSINQPIHGERHTTQFLLL